MAARVTLLAILAAIFLVLNLPSAYTKPVQDLSSRRPEIDGLHHHLGDGQTRCRRERERNMQQDWDGHAQDGRKRCGCGE